MNTLRSVAPLGQAEGACPYMDLGFPRVFLRPAIPFGI